MTAEIIQFVPRPNPKRDETDHLLASPANAERLLRSIESIPFGGQGIDGMVFTDNDPA